MLTVLRSSTSPTDSNRYGRPGEPFKSRIKLVEPERLSGYGLTTITLNCAPVAMSPPATIQRPAGQVPKLALPV